VYCSHVGHTDGDGDGGLAIDVEAITEVGELIKDAEGDGGSSAEKILVYSESPC
jgi:hypothetical protein